MNKITIVIICSLTTVFVSGGMAQSVNENQMDQEIEIMEGILDQLFFQNYRKHSRGENVRGNYLPGFGLIFKIPRYENYFMGRNVTDNINAVIVDESRQLVIGQNIFMKNKMDSVHEASNAHFNETIRLFFIDYGDLISQLEGNDNILIVFGYDASSQSNQFIHNPFIRRKLKDEGVEEIRPASKITAQVSYNDILKYKSGKTTENQFAKNIRLSEKSVNEAIDQEFNILAGIFEKIYGRHGGSFVNNLAIGFERIDGLGVIYEMSLGNTLLSSGTRVPTISITSGRGVGEEEKNQNEGVYLVPDDYNKKINELKEEQNKAYQELKTKLKQDLIRYGKTLKSLQNGEILMLATTLSNCLGCDKPEKLNLIVKASVLKDYDQRKITLDQAVANITEKEVKSLNKW